MSNKKERNSYKVLSCFSCATRKKAATDWTVGKLLAVVFLVVFLVLVIYGVSTNGLNPLIERAGGMVNQVLLLFGIGDKDSGIADGDCGSPHSVTVDGAGRGMLTRCKKECKLIFDDVIGYIGNNFVLDISQQPFTFRSDYLVLQGKVVNLEEVNNKREIYPLLRDSFYSVIRGKEVSGVPLSEDNTDEMKELMGQWNVVLYLKVVQSKDLLLKYQMRESGGVGDWYELIGGEWVRMNWINAEALDKIYSASYNVLDDRQVYWRIGEYENYESIPGATLRSSLLSEDWKYENEAYQIIPNMIGDAGEIDGSEDYATFVEWFRTKGVELKNNYDEKIARLQAFDRQFADANVRFNEVDYKVLFKSDLNRPLAYIDSFPKYGLMFSSGILFLSESSEGINWELNKEMDDVVLDDEDWEEVILINKIYNFMEGKCR